MYDVWPNKFIGDGPILVAKNSKANIKIHLVLLIVFFQYINKYYRNIYWRVDNISFVIMVLHNQRKWIFLECIKSTVNDTAIANW